MDNTTVNTRATADPAEAEQTTKPAAPDTGKFSDVAALLEAYNNLEAEFTRRSQRLRELEKAVKPQPPAQASSGVQAPQPEPQPTHAAGEVSESTRAQIIAQFLSEAARGGSVPLIQGGVNLSARRNAPTSVTEAGALAQQFLSKRR